MNAPARPCPPWCQERHDGPEPAISHQRHCYSGGSPCNSDSGVTLYMSDYGTDSPELDSYNGQLSLHVWARGSGEQPAVFIDLQDHQGVRDARKLAALLAALGHEDLAAGIGDMLALAGAEVPA